LLRGAGRGEVRHVRNMAAWPRRSSSCRADAGLARTRHVVVRGPTHQGSVPSPTANLLGAILVKARAVEVDDVPTSQLADLAFPC
jgi:hypothetical protein